MARLLRQGGTILSAVIGSYTSLNHDAQKYSWSRFVETEHDASTEAIDFDGSHYMGSGVSVDGDGAVITIGAGGGGLYIVSACTHNHINHISAHQWKVRVNGTDIDSPQQYANFNATGIQYYMTAGTLIMPVPLDAADTIQIYGTGHITVNPDTAFFNGIRIGAKS